MNVASWSFSRGKFIIVFAYWGWSSWPLFRIRRLPLFGGSEITVSMGMTIRSTQAEILAALQGLVVGRFDCITQFALTFFSVLPTGDRLLQWPLFLSWKWSRQLQQLPYLRPEDQSKQKIAPAIFCTQKHNINFIGSKTIKSTWLALSRWREGGDENDWISNKNLVGVGLISSGCGHAPNDIFD